MSDLLMQWVGDILFMVFNQIWYCFFMLFLDNVFNVDELVVFDWRICECFGIEDEIEFVCELKLDGLVVSLLYEQGVLVQVVICGDG